MITVAAFFVGRNSRCKHGVNTFRPKAPFQTICMDFNYGAFDKLVARQASILWIRVQGAYPEARSPQAKQEMGTNLIRMFYEAKDSFGEQVIERFQTAYDLGLPLLDTLNLIVEQFKNRAAEKDRVKVYTRKIVLKGSKGAAESHVEHFEDGELVSRLYQDADGGIRVVDVKPQQMLSFYQHRALDTPSAKNVYKFIVSNFCAQVLKERLIEYFEKAADNKAPIELSVERRKSCKLMTWNGTQKELGELFLELKKKGWVDDYNFEAIRAAFTPTDAIDQAMRPGVKKDFKNIYTTFYKPSFDKIKECSPTKAIERTKKP